MIEFNKKTNYELIKKINLKQDVVLWVFPITSSTVGLDKDDETRYKVTKDKPLILKDIVAVLNATENNALDNEEILLWKAFIELAFNQDGVISYYNYSELKTIVNIKFYSSNSNLECNKLTARPVGFAVNTSCRII